MSTPTVEQIFSTIEAGAKADPTIAPKIGGVYHFKIADKSWILDMKNGSGSVKQAAPEKADVTITVAEPDFINLMTGKVNGQNLFMQGKLKIQGNMGLAMKLDKLPREAPKPAAGKSADASKTAIPAAPAAAPIASNAANAPVSSSSSGLRAAAVFDELSKRIASNPDLVKKVNGVYQFEITKDGKTAGTWFVDLKNGKGSVGSGKVDKVDCTITAADDDFVGMMTGKANSQQLFMSGKLKIKGNMGLAMKLGQLSAAKSSL